MPYKRPTSVVVSRTALACLILGLSANMTAGAAPRYAAPIIYRGDAAPLVSAPATRSAPVFLSEDKAGARIAFRYPGASPTAVPASSAAPTEVDEPLPPLILQPAPSTVTSAALAPLPAASTSMAGTGQGPRYLTGSAKIQPTTADSQQDGFVKNGRASVYGDEFAGLPTANGEVFSQAALSAAHPSFPLPSLVRVTEPISGREIVVRVNDRGPFQENADLQLSKAAADALGVSSAGTSPVTLHYIGPAPVLAEASLSAEPPHRTDEGLGAARAQPRQEIIWPVAAEDTELLGGGPMPPPARSLMSLRTQPQPALAGTGVFVQLGAYTDLGNAERMMRSISHRLPTSIEPARVNGADFFRVRVGPFSSRDAAEEVRDRLYADGTANGRVVFGP